MKTQFKFKTLFIVVIAGSVVLYSCSEPAENISNDDYQAEEVTEVIEPIVYDTNSPESMLNAVAAACGGMDQLKALNDISFDYHYLKPDGKKDISVEKYIFDNEVSWANYSVHEENVSPDLEGNIVQYFDGEKAFAYNNGEALSDPKVVGTSQFLRQANYMWFTMMFKLTDPGTIHKYMGQEDVDGTVYDLVNVSYDPAVTGKEQNDIFILYINPETHMVESFKFSLPAFGIEAPILLAKLTYEEIEGLQIVTRREMMAPSPDGNGMVPMVEQLLKNIKFNNGFTAEVLSKEI